MNVNFQKSAEVVPGVSDWNLWTSFSVCFHLSAGDCQPLSLCLVHTLCWTIEEPEPSLLPCCPGSGDLEHMAGCVVS